MWDAQCSSQVNRRKKTTNIQAMCERFWSLLKLFFHLSIGYAEESILDWATSHTISAIYDLLKWINLSNSAGELVAN